MKFVQRTEKVEMSTPEKSNLNSSKEDGPKWEIMSECESLPQDERIDLDEEVKQERMTLRQRDLSPATSVDTRSSERSKNKNEDELELSLESSIERLRSRLEEPKKRKRSKDSTTTENSSVYPKRRLRDVSPASSIEPLIERRLKEERASASGDERKGKKAPRWRKKYLIAGLFSDYYKENE